MGHYQPLRYPQAGDAPVQPELYPWSRCPSLGLACGRRDLLALSAASSQGCSGACCMCPGDTGGQQTCRSTFPTPSLSPQGRQRVPERGAWGRDLAARLCRSLGLVEGQHITVPDGCRMPGCTRELLRCWDPPGS